MMVGIPDALHSVDEPLADASVVSLSNGVTDEMRDPVTSMRACSVMPAASMTRLSTVKSGWLIALPAPNYGCVTVLP